MLFTDILDRDNVVLLRELLGHDAVCSMRLDDIFGLHDSGLERLLTAVQLLIMLLII